MKKNLFRTIIAAALLLAICVSFSGCAMDATPDGIKKKGELVIGTDPNFPPFEYMEGTKIVGWDMDIAQIFADELGVKLKIKDMKFESVLASVKKGSVHIGMAGISNTAERAKSVDFTDPVIDSSQMIIVKNGETAITDAMSLADKKVGVAKGYMGEMLADLNPDVAYDGDDAILGKPGEVKRYNSGAEAVEALIGGHVDAVIMDKYPAEQFVKAKEGIMILEGSIYDDEYSFAVKKGNKELLDILNATIAKIVSDGRMEQITKKHFG